MHKDFGVIDFEKEEIVDIKDFDALKDIVRKEK